MLGSNLKNSRSLLTVQQMIILGGGEGNMSPPLVQLGIFHLQETCKCHKVIQPHKVMYGGKIISKLLTE